MMKRRQTSIISGTHCSNSSTPFQGWSINAARFAKWDEGHVCQQEACCIDVVCNAKVAPLCVCIGTSLPSTRPQGPCQLLSAKYDGNEHRHVLVSLPHMEEHPEHDRFITVWACLSVHNHAENSLQACVSHTNLAIIVHDALPGPLVLALRVVSKQGQAAD